MMTIVLYTREAPVAHIFMKQQVADYEPWREYFDSQEEWRANAGISVHSVMQDTADPNTVWIHQEADAARGEPVCSRSRECLSASDQRSGELP
jgi:hypothetical protein